MRRVAGQGNLLRALEYPVGESLAARRRFWRDTALAYAYLLPSLAVLGVFSLYPVYGSLVLSLYDWDLISPVRRFVGLGNYRELLADPDFWQALQGTTVYVAGTVLPGIVLSLGVALLLNRRIAMRAFYRAAFFMPYVATVVAISMVWGWIYHDQWGLLNQALGWAGIRPQRWLLDPRWAMFAVILISVWKGLGWNVVIFLAGLQNIDREVYAAARVDGAAGWRLFRYVTWPLLAPTTFFVSILAIIHAFKVFTEVYVLFGGSAGPLRSALTMVFFVYEKAFGNWRMGYASAAAYVLFFLIMGFTLAQLAYGRRIHYS